MIGVTKEGKLAKDQEGNLVLVNGKEQAYKVDESVIAIWQMCDGKSQEEICNTITEKTQMGEDEAKKAVGEIVPKLEEVGLVKTGEQSKSSGEEKEQSQKTTQEAEKKEEEAPKETTKEEESQGNE